MPERRHRGPLTAKQRLWAVDYLLTDNASQAALNAGYSHRQRGHENVTNRVVEQFLDEHKDSTGIMDKTTADHLFAEAITMMKEAKESGAKARCLELAMRAKGMFVTSVEITDKTNELEANLAALGEQSPELAAVLAKELGLGERKDH